MDKTDKKDISVLRDPTDVDTPLLERLEFLNSCCAALIERIKSNNEKRERLSEVRNIQYAVYLAIDTLNVDDIDQLHEGLTVYLDARTRLRRLESDSNYLGKFARGRR